MRLRLPTVAAVVVASLAVLVPAGTAGAAGPCGTQPQPSPLIRGADTADKVYVEGEEMALYPRWNWVDAHGVLHSAGIGGCPGPDPAELGETPRWPGWDIARGLATYRDPAGEVRGWVLDGWGGLHRLNDAPRWQGPYWYGWDIARDLAITDDGSWGVVLDGFGAVHALGAIPAAARPMLREVTYWHGWDIARAVVLEPDGAGGWVFDAWGGLHPFGGARQLVPGDNVGLIPDHYLPGRDWVRTASIEEGGSLEQVIVAGVLDGRYVQARWHPAG